MMKYSVGLAWCLLLGVSVAPASGDTLNTYLTTASQLLSEYSAPYSGPYGLVTTNLLADGRASVTFLGQVYSLSTVEAIFFRPFGSVALNVNASAFSVGFGCITYWGRVADCSDTGPINTQFGTFNLSITDLSRSPDLDGLAWVELYLTNESGTWATAADVLALNSNGYDVMAGVLAVRWSGFPPPVLGQAAGSPPPSAVPEPTTILLLLSGAGLALCRSVGRERRR